VKAIRVAEFGGPEVMQLVDLPDPAPGPAEVAVQLHAAGVNPVDAYVRSGNYARLPQLPYTPGSDGAGVITALGEGVTTRAVGDRVYVAALGIRDGTYAERMACPAHQVHTMPAHTTFAQGAALGVPAATAYRALVLRAQVKAGETVLVHGASGAVGNCAVQLARALGLTVIGTAGSEAGLAAVQKSGAAHALNHHEEGYAKHITELTSGKGVDVVLEMLANVNLDRDLGLLAPKGRVVVIGSRGRIEIDPRQTMGKESAVLGTTLWATTPDEYRQIHAGLEGALASRALEPLVGRELPLDAAQEAHRVILQDRAVGKIVLTM
jgi:NADPH2:quinone reductase